MSELRVRPVLCILGILVATACRDALRRGEDSPEQPEPFPEPLASLAEQIAAPGIVAGVFRNGKLAEELVWGGAGCQSEGVVDPAFGYEIGSISKHVTAIALLELWDRGLVDLDAPIERFVPDVPPAWRPVSLRQLLNHTGGVPDYEAVAGYGIYGTTPTPAEVLEIVRDRPLEFEPGTSWSYSNTGYYLLSLVIERVSHQRFADYLHDHVFAPLGLAHTAMSSEWPPNAPRAQGCWQEAKTASHVPVAPITDSSTLGAGGIVSTLADWAAWDAALDNGALISQAAMAALIAPPVLPSGESTGYGFGLWVDEFRGTRRLAHSGQTQGFSSSYVHLPDEHVGILVLANTYGARLGALTTALTLRALPELSYTRLTAPADPDPVRTARIRHALRQAILGEQPPDLLEQDMRTFATDPRFEAARASMLDLVASMDRFEYLQSEVPPSGDYIRHLYRVASGDRVAYFTFGWRKGKLYRMRWEDE